MRANNLVTVAALTAGIVMVSGGCGDDSTTSSEDAVSNDITAEVEEWDVEVDAQNAKAGAVTFNVTNDGKIKHEFVVVKTDLPVGEIPIGPDNVFDEENPDVEVVDEIEEFDAGTTQTLEVDLEPGAYQLVCNLPDHYKNGMYREFTVTT